MPAIVPARLAQQAAMLAEHFNDPPAFVRSLHHLLTFYAERATRPGQAGEPPPLLTAYRVRPPVLRRILVETAPLAKSDPVAGLALCDALWAEPVLEFRLLAAGLLGQVPCLTVEDIVVRLRTWLKPDVEERLVKALFEQGVSCLRLQNSPAVIDLARYWLDETNLFYRQLGLRLLAPLANDPSYENLPAFFRLIEPLVRTTPSILRPDVLDVLLALVRRSPVETAYFLRQAAELPGPEDALFLLRQCLSEFPPDIQQDLREFARRQADAGRKK